MEHRLTSKWVENLIGPARAERVLILWPDDAEHSTDMYTTIVKSEAVSVVLYDSVGGAPSQRVTQKSATIGNFGGNSQAMTRLAQFASIFADKYSTLTIFINQEREDMTGYMRYITPGGRALKHAYSLRIRLRKGKEKFNEKIDGETVQVGYSVKAQIVKNSMAPPYRECYYLFYNVPTEKYGFGIDTLEETVRLGVLTGVVTQQGRGWFYHDSLPGGKCHGEPALIEAVRSNSSTRETLISEIKQRLESGNGAGVAPTFDPEADNDVSESFFHRFASDDPDALPLEA
jgi:recombination protein RecA